MLISKSKLNYLRPFFRNNLKNYKQLWNKISEFINKKQKEMDNIFLSENGAIITEQKIVANIFKKYFINVAQNMLKGLGESNSRFQDYLNNRNENSFKKGKRHLWDIN